MAFRFEISYFLWESVVFLECKGAHSGSKRTNFDLGFQDSKQSKCLQNKRKCNKTIVGLMTGIGLELGELTAKHGQEGQDNHGKRENHEMINLKTTPWTRQAPFGAPISLEGKGSRSRISTFPFRAVGRLLERTCSTQRSLVQARPRKGSTTHTHTHTHSHPPLTANFYGKKTLPWERKESLSLQTP